MLISPSDSVRALAFSWSISTEYCGVSSCPFGRVPDRTGLCAAQAEQLVARLHQLGVTGAGDVLQIEFEAGAVAEALDRGRGEREDHAVLDAAEGTHGAARDSLGAGLLADALLEGLEPDEGDADILARPAEAEARDREHTLDEVLFLLLIMLPDLVQHPERAILRRAHGQLHDGEEHPLVLVGQEGARQPREEIDHAAADQQEDQHEAHRPAIMPATPPA